MGFVKGVATFVGFVVIGLVATGAIVAHMEQKKHDQADAGKL